MKDTEKLPPGSTSLTFDPNDRATWSGKIYGRPDGPQSPAKLVHILSDGAILAVATGAGGGEFYFQVSPDGKSRLSPFRLYDAAPEPVKPREWWAIVHRANGSVLHIFDPDEQKMAEERLQACDHPKDWHLVRLIEAPVPEDRS